MIRKINPNLANSLDNLNQDLTDAERVIISEEIQQYEKTVAEFKNRSVSEAKKRDE